MLIAQTAGEYGGLSGMTTAFATVFARGQELLSNLGTKEYVVIGVAAVVMIVLFGRRRR